jgi:cytochrome c oxidase cbb3-type subunit 2
MSVRYTYANAAVFFLASLAAGSSIGQVLKSAHTGVPTTIPSDSGASPEMNYDAEKGRALYINQCSACHGADGEGRPGTYPPLKASGMVNKDDATKHIRAVLDGLQGAKAGGVLYTSPMPPFGSVLNDADVADIVDYERSSWGNHGKLVAPAQVAAERGHSK